MLFFRKIIILLHTLLMQCFVNNINTLWLAVIKQAFMDIVSGGKGINGCINRREAMEWVFDENDDFDFVCSCAGSNKENIRKLALDLIEVNIASPVFNTDDSLIHFADKIATAMPKKINNFYDLFGGTGYLLASIYNCEIKIKKYNFNETNPHLYNFWYVFNSSIFSFLNGTEELNVKYDYKNFKKSLEQYNILYKKIKKSKKDNIVMAILFLYLMSYEDATLNTESAELEIYCSRLYIARKITKRVARLKKLYAIVRKMKVTNFDYSDINVNFYDFIFANQLQVKYEKLEAERLYNYLTSKGATFLLATDDCQEIRELYKNYIIEKVSHKETNKLIIKNF